MVLFGKIFIWVVLFAVIGLVLGIIVIIIIKDPNTIIKMICLAGGPIVGAIISLFNIEFIIEKHYGER